MSKKFAIQCTDIAKRYSKSQKHGDLRSTLSSLFGKKEVSTDFWALKDINFTIEQGETVGIIGRNGAGKSTLLKLLSKITHPTEGVIKIKGRLTSLLEVGTGFHPQLTGRENIYLNGSLLGMTRNEINQRMEGIVDFSGVRGFIDMPVKHYSSGMYVRLAFSVAAHLRTDILLVDEVLAVGDALFQEKSLNKMNEVVLEGRTVLLVSHNMEHINTLCKKAMFLNNGRLDFFGDTSSCIRAYTNSYSTVLEDKDSFYEIFANGIKVSDVIHSFSGQTLVFTFKPLNKPKDIDKIKLIFLDNSNKPLFVANSEIYLDIKTKNRNTEIECTIPRLTLNDGNFFLVVEYKLGGQIKSSSRFKLFVGKGNFYGTNRNVGSKYSVLLDHTWNSR